MMKQMTWVLVIVALAVGVFIGYTYEKSKLSGQMMMAEGALQKQVSDLQMKNDNLMKMEVTPTGMMMHTTVTPTGMMEK